MTLEQFQLILGGIGLTAMTALLTLILASAIGLIALLGRLWKPTSKIAGVFTDLFQNAPYPVLVFLIFYGLPEIGVTLTPFGATILGIGLYTGAYIAEALRTGVKAVSVGIVEAGFATGLSRWTVVMHIVLPQAIVYSMPSLTNQWCRGLRNISVMAMLGGHEILFVSQQLADQTFLIFLYYGLAGISYWLLSLPIVGAASFAERRVRWTERVGTTTKRANKLRKALA